MVAMDDPGEHINGGGDSEGVHWARAKFVVRACVGIPAALVAASFVGHFLLPACWSGAQGLQTSGGDDSILQLREGESAEAEVEDPQPGACMPSGTWNEKGISCRPGSAGIAMFQEVADCLKQLPAFAVAERPGNTKAAGNAPAVIQPSYLLTYGIFLQHLRQGSGPTNLLEVGPGCEGMPSTAALWRRLLPQSKLLKAYACPSYQGSGSTRAPVKREDRARPLSKTAARVPLNVVIDKGGMPALSTHRAFDSLWPHVEPGGLYILEGLHRSRLKEKLDLGVSSMADVIRDWLVQLIIPLGPRRFLAHGIPENTSFIHCQAAACVVGKSAWAPGPTRACGASSPAIWELVKAAKAVQPKVPDKVTDHHYELIYGLLLPPAAAGTVKMLEIGDGCGIGASARLWVKVVPRVQLWQAEGQECIDKARKEGLPAAVQTLTGGEGNAGVVAQWVTKSGGHFDIVIDDGKHQSDLQMISFNALWPHVVPGGLYIIEDLHVARHPAFLKKGVVSMADVIEEWVEQLMLLGGTKRPGPSGNRTLPANVSFILCQEEACVVAKAAAAPPQGARRKPPA